MHTDEPLRLQMPRWVHPLWVGAVVLPALVACSVYLGVLLTAIIGTAATVAFAGWLATTYRRPASRRIIPWYVAAVVALLVHAWEQWSTGYADTVVALTPAGIAPPAAFDQAGWLHIFPLATTVIFLLGALAVFYHHPIGNYLAWLVFVSGAVLPLSHPVLLLAAGTVGYVPGMYAAVPLLGVAAVGLMRLVTDRVEAGRR